MEALIAEHFNQVLEERFPVEFDHGFRPPVRQRAQPGSTTTSQNHRLCRALDRLPVVLDRHDYCPELEPHAAGTALARQAVKI